MSRAVKKHDSCIRVLEFLKILFEKDIDIKDLKQKDRVSLKNIEAPETFLKYISTLYLSGLNIKKIDKKYSLCSYLSEIELDKDEIELFAEIYKCFNHCCVETMRKDFDEIAKIIINYLKEPSKTVFINKIETLKEKRNNNISEKALRFQNYVDLGQKLKIEYNGETIIIEPKNVEIENQKIYLIVYNSYSASNMKLLTDNIENIELLPIKNSTINMTLTVAFEVYDRLAVNYRLRENEKIQTFSDGYKLIINYGEDKKELIKRLMKYGENCKIISPKPFQEEFLKELTIIEEKLQGVLK